MNPRPWIGALALTGVLTMLAASPVFADRSATRAEWNAIRRAVGARKCEVGRIRISTVNPRWAVFSYGYAKGSTASSCPNVPTGRLFLYKGHNSRWHKRASGSDITCAQDGLPSRKVQADLDTLCHEVRF
jgi:hypothetical protein